MSKKHCATKKIHFLLSMGNLRGGTGRGGESPPLGGHIRSSGWVHTGASRELLGACYGTGAPKLFPNGDGHHKRFRTIKEQETFKSASAALGTSRGVQILVIVGTERTWEAGGRQLQAGERAARHGYVHICRSGRQTQKKTTID